MRLQIDNDKGSPDQTLHINVAHRWNISGLYANMSVSKSRDFRPPRRIVRLGTVGRWMGLGWMADSSKGRLWMARISAPCRTCTRNPARCAGSVSLHIYAKIKMQKKRRKKRNTRDIWKKGSRERSAREYSPINSKSISFFTMMSRCQIFYFFYSVFFVYFISLHFLFKNDDGFSLSFSLSLFINSFVRLFTGAFTGSEVLYMCIRLLLPLTFITPLDTADIINSKQYIGHKAIYKLFANV